MKILIYRQQWNNDNDNNWRNNQFNREERDRQDRANNYSDQFRDTDYNGYNSYGRDRDYPQSNSRKYTSFGEQDSQNRGDRNWYGRQYENQYNSNSDRAFDNRNNGYRSSEYETHRGNDRDFRSRNDYNNSDRGWWDKTTDEVSSWFGDEDAKRRRRMDEMREDNHRGKGPKNYTRSSERIKEDVNDHLGDHWMLDASNIEVAVDGTEVTLTGTVDSKENKRRAEDIADSVSGVTHVQNNLRVKKYFDNDDMKNDNTSKVSTANNYTTKKEALNHN